MKRSRWQVEIAFAACLALTPSALRGATVTIVNSDPAGIGFNDPTPVAPAGGNTGTTLGQQRMIAFQAAANKWGATVASNINIRVSAAWTALTCTSNSAILGLTGAAEIFRDFPGAPVGGHWYAKALANKFAGVDLDPNSVDINAQFNINLGQSGCLAGLFFYLGLDNNHGGNVDLVAVITHELAHGLGFQTYTNTDGQSGAEFAGYPSIWDDFLLDNTTNKTWTMMTAAERVASAVNTGHLVWNGGNLSSAIPQVLQPQGSSYTGADPQGRGLMYAPGSYLGGSSVMHFDTSMVRDQLMEPAIHGDLTHEVTPPYDLTFPLLKDIGWTAGSGTVPGQVTLASPGSGAANQSRTPALSWSASGNATSYDLYLGSSNPPAVYAQGLSSTSYAVSTALNAGSTYYWNVVAKNSAGSAPASTTWSFTTVASVPAQVTLASPGNGTTNQSTTPALSWTASGNATSYDLYLGSSSPPAVYAQNLSGTSFAVSTALNVGSTYYWNVVAKNSAGSAPASSTWSFTTVASVPAQVTLTSPGSGAANQSTTPALSWTASGNAASYDLYLGTSSPPAVYAQNLSGTSFVVSTALNAGSTYYWNVVAKNSAGSAPASSTWSFMTASATGLPSAGLIGYWNFDEGSGSVAHDTSGGGHNGAVNGAVWTTGKINTGLLFNGSSNSVITPAIPLGAAFSISAWVNPSAIPQVGYIRIAETYYATGFFLGTDTTGTKYKLIVNDASGATGSCGYGCAEGGAISSGWHLVTATFDGATARLYVDNAVVGSDTFTAPSNTNLPLNIGISYVGSGYGWNGTIDEVRLYNRAVTSAEVSAIYSYTGGTPDTTPPSTPGNVTATAVSSSQINVSWSASTDNVGVAGYRVYRNGALAGTVTALSYSDTGLAASTTYTYTVAAFDAAGNVSGVSAGAAATTLGMVDTTPPSTPGNVTATAVSSSQINVSWSASTDNVGVAGYRVFRNGTLAGTVTALSYSDTGLAASTTYSYTVSAFDAAGNVSSPSTAATATTMAVVDTTPPSVSITSPSANSTVSNTITVTATASDNVAVADVQFQLDGVNLGADLTSAPYTITWNTTTASNGSHNLTAIARDTSHNSATSAVVPVTVNNTVTGPPTSGLIGYWNFDEGSGSVAHDTSGGGHNGAVNGAVWTTGKINTGLLFNGSSSSVITPAIVLGAAFSISAWVNPSVIPQVGYVRIAETYYATGFYLGTDTTGTKYKLIVNGGAGVTGSCGYGCAEGGTISSGWHLVTATFDGATARLYVDNAVAGSDTFTAPSNTDLPLNIGISYVGSGYGWNGTIDEVRLYNRAVTSAEVSAIYSYTGGPPDTTPPSTPGNVTATAVSSSQINVSWSASTDNVGVAGYRVFRNGTLAGTVTALSYSDTGLAASTTYSYTVSAFDAAGNVSSPSTAATATTLAVVVDTTPPSVSITSPSANSTVSNTITVTATASDNVAVADVQFQLDGVNLGADLTSAPYTITWNTTTASNGSHNLTAIARDTSHNSATSAVVPVTVNNTVTGPPTSGLIGYWNFDEGSGSVAHDTSGGGHNGAVNGAVWTTGKINTGLLFNGSSSSVITPAIPLGAAFSISAWVNPSAIPQVGYIRIAETYYATGFYLGTDTTGTKYKLIVNDASGATGSCSYGCAEGGAISSGWHLVTATFDGATARLYVDNAVVGSDTFTAPSNTSLPLNIGISYVGSGYGWNGTIDEVRLYNRALTAAEVNAIFNY